MRTPPRTAVVTALASAMLVGPMLVGPLATTASAHGIIDLDGVSAVAGASSLMTLEVQHGCATSDSTIEVQAFVGKPWRAVKPQPVAGWSSRVARQDKGGWQITWTNLGAPIPFGTPIFFPIKVAWPAKPGTYGMSVLQLCPDSSYYWNDEYTPANGSVTSPPLTPRPEVLVVAPSTPATKKSAQIPSSRTPSKVHHH